MIHESPELSLTTFVLLGVISWIVLRGTRNLTLPAKEITVVAGPLTEPLDLVYPTRSLESFGSSSSFAPLVASCLLLPWPPKVSAAELRVLRLARD